MLAWLVTGPDGRYEPGIGDPTLLGWLTVFAYAYAAFRTLRAARVAARRARAAHDTPAARDERTLERVFRIVTGGLLVLGINKQLDLQTLLVQFVRDAAQASGWYEDRRRYQVLFILAIVALGIAGTLAVGVLLRRVVRRIPGVIFGGAFLVVFVVVRAATFHHVDAFLGSLKEMRAMLELGGIVFIARSARKYAAPRSSRSPAR